MYTVDKSKIRRLREIDSKLFTLEKYEDLILAPHAAYKGVYSYDKKDIIRRSIVTLYNIAYDSEDLSCYDVLIKAYEGTLDSLPVLLKENPLPLHLAIDYLCIEDPKIKRLCINHLKEEEIDWAHQKALEHMRRHLNALYSLKSKKGKDM